MLIFMGLLLTSNDCLSQSQGKRPLVGLVLSGGGSHGIAHVGVLKVMEEAGLRPDIITGTSMGSIIGGFYSMGYSTDSLIKIMKQMNWDLLLSNNIPLDKIFFSEKKYSDNSVMSLPLSSRKVKFPSGLISGQQIENALSYYAWPAATINDFSKLPIPFMCVGADLITVSKVDLKTGYLPDALRASSAIPTVFSPIQIDTYLLSDGGLINNFPADEAKELGADYLVGSYVGFRPLPENDLMTIRGIVEQIGFSRSLEDFDRQKKLIDILVSPVVKPYPILDFKPVDSIVAIGYRAALPYKEKFKRIADSLNKLGVQKPIPFILDRQFYSFDKIVIEGNKIIPANQILGLLDIEPGEKIGKQYLYDKVELLYGMNWFEKVKYRIVPGGDSLALIIECTEKPKIMFYGAVHYDNALGAGLLMSVSVKNIVLQGSEFNLSSYIGQYYRLNMSMSQLVGKNKKFGLSADLRSDYTPVPILTINSESGDWKSINLATGLNIYRIFGLNQMLTLSFDYENRYLVPLYVSKTDLKFFRYNYLTSSFNYQVNSLDNRHFPEKGSLVSIYAGFGDLFSGSIKKGNTETDYNKKNPGEFSMGNYYTLKADWEHYFKSPGRLTISLKGDVLYINHCDSLSSQNNFFILGGITPLNDRSVAMFGFHPGEIPVKQMAGLGMGFDWKLTKDLHFNLAGNFAAIREADRETGYSLLAGYGVGLGYMSILGPVRAGIMQGFYGEESYFKSVKSYISVGFTF